MQELTNLKSKVHKYKEIRQNTRNYRKAWDEYLRDQLVDLLSNTCEEVGLTANIQIQDQVANLSAVTLSLGKEHSGIYEVLQHDMKRPFIRTNGMLVYQQLFNGKIIVLIILPHIEGVGEPQPSKMVAIYRPEELQPPFIIRHLEEFFRDITEWEDYDDDIKEPQKIGFNMNFNMNQFEDDEME